MWKSWSNPRLTLEPTLHLKMLDPTFTLNTDMARPRTHSQRPAPASVRRAPRRLRVVLKHLQSLTTSPEPTRKRTQAPTPVARPSRLGRSRALRFFRACRLADLGGGGNDDAVDALFIDSVRTEKMKFETAACRESMPTVASPYLAGPLVDRWPMDLSGQHKAVSRAALIACAILHDHQIPSAQAREVGHKFEFFAHLTRPISAPHAHRFVRTPAPPVYSGDRLLTPSPPV